MAPVPSLTFETVRLERQDSEVPEAEQLLRDATCGGFGGQEKGSDPSQDKARHDQQVGGGDPRFPAGEIE